MSTEPKPVDPEAYAGWCREKAVIGKAWLPWRKVCTAATYLLCLQQLIAYQAGAKADKIVLPKGRVP